MGLFDKFGKGKKEGQDGENLTANEPQESNAVIEARKAHEGMEWPTIQRINPIKINDVEEYAMEETVDPARKDELGELIYKEEITADDIKELSGQEIIFLLSALEMFNKKAPLPEY